MELSSQKRTAAKVLKCSPKRVYFSPDHLAQIKEAITKQDIRELINTNVIQKVPAAGVSRTHAKKRLMQKRKGKRRGSGAKQGKLNARQPGKRVWINRMRSQRGLIKTLREKGTIERKVHAMLYRKVGGGFFRSLAHLKYYLKEKDLLKNVKKK